MAEIDWDARARALVVDVWAIDSRGQQRVAAALREAYAEGERAEREAIVAGLRAEARRTRGDSEFTWAAYEDAAEWVASRSKEPTP